MTEFVVEMPHTEADCLKGLDEMAGKGDKFLKQVRWGCPSGVHIGWAIVEAKDESEVRNLVGSPVMLSKARIVKVSRFSRKDVESFHKK